MRWSQLNPGSTGHGMLLSATWHPKDVNAMVLGTVLLVQGEPKINTVAGNGVHSYGGDGGPATSAMLYQPAGVALDGQGNLFIADHFNHRVRKVDTLGVITTVAGNGVAAWLDTAETEALPRVRCSTGRAPWPWGGRRQFPVHRRHRQPPRAARGFGRQYHLDRGRDRRRGLQR